MEATEASHLLLAEPQIKAPQLQPLPNVSINVVRTPGDT
jgi:hypothetical protein